jgi:hypothetical protein
MSHDKIKAAARKRKAATGEPYAVARRLAISEHNAAELTSTVSGDDIRAAAAAHRELGPDYSDAVVASFIERVDRAVAARVEARLADPARSESARLAGRGRRLLARRVARDVLAAGAGALIAVGAVGLHELTSAQPGSPASGRQVVIQPQQGAGRVWQVKLNPGSKVRHFTIVTPASGSTKR